MTPAFALMPIYCPFSLPGNQCHCFFFFFPQTFIQMESTIYCRFDRFLFLQFFFFWDVCFGSYFFFPFCCWAVFLSISWRSMTYTISLSIHHFEGLLGCFSFLATVTKATMKVDILVLFSLGKIHMCGIGWIICRCMFTLGNWQTFPQWLYPFAFPPVA